MSFGVVPWQLADDATIVVIGDWGSGGEDAVQLLADAIRKAGPRLGAILHLGDVYYSGQPSECEEKIVKATALAFKAAGVAPVPTFWTPGNHEYYSLGHGFYQTFKKLNAGNARATQQASYFCLRTRSGKWQFLGMDTGQSDYQSAEGAFGLPSPKLRPTKIA